MRRKDREVTEIEELLKIIEKCKVCRVAVQDEQGLYIIPLNFGYRYDGGDLILYFHSAREGRKVRAFAAGSQAAFEMDCGHQLVKGELACEYGYRYQSVTGAGQIREIQELKEKKMALSQLMKHQAGFGGEFDERMVKAVAVYELKAEWFTGKRCK